MGNSFTETSTQSWESILIGSIKSVFVGVILLLIALVALWFNEGRAVKTAKGLTEGASQVVDISSEAVSQESSGKLVHLTGDVQSKEQLTDTEFGITVDALRLKRSVYMYQWVEHKKTKSEKKVGGSKKTTTTYEYEKQWGNTLIKSSSFKKPEGHMNPAAFPIAAYNNQVKNATIGAYDLPHALLSNIRVYVPYQMSSIDTLLMKNALIINESGVSEGSSVQKIYIGSGTNAEPQLGDVKVLFAIIEKGQPYSIVSKQIGSSFEKFNTSTGTSINVIAAGAVSSDSMFTAAQESNVVTTWVIRIVGFLMLFFGLKLIFDPLVVLADVLPFLGNLLSMGNTLFAGVVAFILSFVTFAIAWIFYRPVLGMSMLVIGIGTFVFFNRKKKGDVAAIK